MGRRPQHCPSFFKILIGNFATMLRIPPAFVASLGRNLPKSAVIKAYNNGKSWEVKIRQSCKGQYYFKRHNWRQLVKDCKFKVGDFLVFRLISHSVFEFVAYGPNACEKEIHLHPVIKTEPPTLSEDNPPTASPNRNGMDGLVGEDAGSANPIISHCFRAILKKYNTAYLSFPKSFAMETRIAEKNRVVLRNEEGEVWAVELRECNGRVDMSGGWSDFRVANNIAVGDTCYFKTINQNGGGGVLIQVEVLRNKGKSRA